MKNLMIYMTKEYATLSSSSADLHHLHNIVVQQNVVVCDTNVWPTFVCRVSVAYVLPLVNATGMVPVLNFEVTSLSCL